MSEHCAVRRLRAQLTGVPIKRNPLSTCMLPLNLRLRKQPTMNFRKERKPRMLEKLEESTTVLKRGHWPGRLSCRCRRNLGTEMFRRKPKIFITRPDMPESALRLLDAYDLDIWNEEISVPRDIFLQRIAGKDALFIHSQNRIDAEALNAAGGNLKVIGTISAGLDHIDVEEVKKRGIKLGYTAGVLDDAVAELAVSLLLSCTRRLFEGHRHIVQGTWTPWTRWDWMNGHGLKDSVVGIFGLGRIGTEIARRIVPFKPSRILYASRRAKKEAEELKAEKVSLEELLRECDLVVVSVSLNDETKGIINEAKLALMKPKAFLVNISRGAVIDQEALVRALKDKRIGGAALDVMTPEPIPKDHELLTLDNCTLIPHIGSAEIKTRIQMAETVSRNIIAGLNGTPLPVEV